MAAAISVGIDETDELMTDEDTLAGKRSSLYNDYEYTIAEVFFNVNYVNVNYSVKNFTVDCKYLLFLQDFSLD